MRENIVFVFVFVQYSTGFGCSGSNEEPGASIVYSLFVRFVALRAAATRAPRVSRGSARTLAAYDSGQAAGAVAGWSLERSRGAQSAQVAVRTPQGSR